MLSSDQLKNYLMPLLTRKRVAILGLAREGISTYKTLRRYFPDLDLNLLDQENELDEGFTELLQKDKRTILTTGSAYLDDLGRFDVIFKTPGIPSLLTPIQEAVSAGSYLTSQTDVFFAVFGKQVIAVTGTKGKSTTCKVLCHVLAIAGKQVVFIGNIGRPAFDAIDGIDPDTRIVYETSSHQCEGLRTSPHIAVLLNLYPDHLDYYHSLELYGEAKRQLFVHQGTDDYCLFNCADEKAAVLTADSKAARIGFSATAIAGADVYSKEGKIIAFGRPIISTQSLPLLGSHNWANVMPAIIVARLESIDDPDLVKGLATVKPVEKRLEVVAAFKGIDFIDDALATIPEATIAGLQALGDRVQTLIAGGFDRGQDFSALAQVIGHSSVRHLILFPTTGEKLGKLVWREFPEIEQFPVLTMQEAVRIAADVTGAGKTVLLSTASASFGLFKDYRDRSSQYLTAIRELGK